MEIPQPPRKLFIRGILPDQKRPHLCVVGSRRASQYGQDACQKLISGLAGTDIVIVSGLALGIDGSAHEAALKAGLTTIAVLGSGLEWDTIYPKQHIHLAKEILAAGGAIISEMPPQHKPWNYNFPERNRIMAGLCHATLIIEASPKSGTLITARLALDYNRDVFAVPGSIFSNQSYGPHMLISNGATPITCSEDIILTLKLHTTTRNKEKGVLENCTELERKIYKTLTEPLPRTELLRILPGNVSDISVALSLLEMKGFIEESGGELRQK